MRAALEEIALFSSILYPPVLFQHEGDRLGLGHAGDEGRGEILGQAKFQDRWHGASTGQCSTGRIDPERSEQSDVGITRDGIIGNAGILEQADSNSKTQRKSLKLARKPTCVHWHSQRDDFYELLSSIFDPNA